MSDLSKETSWSKDTISTISYNSLDFFRSKLNQLFQHDLIYDYFFICHKGEDQKKDHIHVLLFPTKSLNLVELRSLFDEEVPDNDPLGVMPFRKTKENAITEWILYCLHDERYLKSKNLVKQTSYSYDDIFRLNEDHFQSYVKAINGYKSDISLIAKYISNGVKWYRAADILMIKRNDIMRFKQAYEGLATAMGVFDDMAEDIVTGEISEVSATMARRRLWDGYEREINELRESLSSAYNVIDKLLKFKQIKLEDLYNESNNQTH